MAATCGALALSTATTQATFTIDGVRDTVNETDYNEECVQATTSAWGAGNALANLHSAQDDSNLLLFIGGRASPDGVWDNAILLFIDSKAGGSSAITNDLITSGSDQEATAPGTGSS